MKYALITGSASGLGLSLTEVALEQGFIVFGTYRKTKANIGLQNKYPSKYYPIKMDVADAESVQNGLQKIEEHLEGKSLDVLINNAAMIKAKPILFSDREDLSNHFHTNVIGPFMLIKQSLSLLSRNGTQGKIININSFAGKLNLPFQGAYGISKAGLAMLSGIIRFEQQPADRVQITDIFLGMMQTEVHQRNANESMDLSASEYSVWAKKMKARINTQLKKSYHPRSVALQIFNIIGKKKMNYQYLISTNLWKIRLLLMLGNKPIVNQLIRKSYFA